MAGQHEGSDETGAYSIRNQQSRISILCTTERIRYFYIPVSGFLPGLVLDLDFMNKNVYIKPNTVRNMGVRSSAKMVLRSRFFWTETAGLLLLSIANFSLNVCMYIHFR